MVTIPLREVNRTYSSFGVDYAVLKRGDYTEERDIQNGYRFHLCTLKIDEALITVSQWYTPSGETSIPYFFVTEGKRTKKGRRYKETEILFSKKDLSKLTGVPVKKLDYHHLSPSIVIAIPYTLHRNPHKEGEKEFNRKVLDCYFSILKGKNRKLLKRIEHYS